MAALLPVALKFPGPLDGPRRRVLLLPCVLAGLYFAGNAGGLAAGLALDLALATVPAWESAVALSAIVMFAAHWLALLIVAGRFAREPAGDGRALHQYALVSAALLTSPGFITGVFVLLPTDERYNGFANLAMPAVGSRRRTARKRLGPHPPLFGWEALSMRAPITLVLTVTLLSAGCLGGDASESASAAEASPPGMSDPADANLTQMEEEEAPAEPAEPVTTEIAYDAQTGTFACYFTPAVRGCQGSFSPESMRDLPYQGTPLTLEGTVTWETSSPTGRELQVAIRVRNGTEVEFNQSMPSVSGASPLSFSFDLTPFEGRELVVDVSSFQGQSAGPVFAGGSMAQPFRLESVLTYRPDA